LGALLKNFDYWEKPPMKTTFETALNKHEISDFFKGDGIYFAKGSEWGDHLYISNWQEMCGVLKNPKRGAELTDNFISRIRSMPG
jgi:hypothetical protein